MQNVYLVALGTVFGHPLCTALAVLGGRFVSTKISVRAGQHRKSFYVVPSLYTINSNAFRLPSIPPLWRHLLLRSNLLHGIWPSPRSRFAHKYHWSLNWDRCYCIMIGVDSMHTNSL